MIWLSLLGTAFGASVVINEAMVNPYGSDAGREWVELYNACLLYTSPSPRDKRQSRMPSSA